MESEKTADMNACHRLHAIIIQEPWFHRNSITEWELLKMILMKRRQLDDNAELSRQCHAEARYRFAQPRSR
jgi:hypothetical protein